MMGGVPRVSRGGTGGNGPPASDRDRLRLALRKQMESCESLLVGGGAGSPSGQNLMGAVRRRLNTVLGLGTGFTMTSQLVSKSPRFGAEVFLNASKLPLTGARPVTD